MNTIERWFFGALFGLLAMQAHAQYYGQNGYQGQTLVCNSSGYSQTYCSADTRGGVTLVRRISNSACVEGQSWGYDGRGVWVSQGCKGEFALRARSDYGNDGNDYGYGGNSNVIRCESSGYQQQYCRIDTRGGVRITRQISDTACIRGRSWDYDNSGVWVSNGCKADFTVGGYDGGNAPGYGVGRTVRCESHNNRTVRCRADTQGSVRLVRRLSGTACNQGRNWDWDRNGIWVSGGCRAEFQIGGFDRNGDGYDGRR